MYMYRTKMDCCPSIRVVALYGAPSSSAVGPLLFASLPSSIMLNKVQQQPRVCIDPI